MTVLKPLKNCQSSLQTKPLLSALLALSLFLPCTSAPAFAQEEEPAAELNVSVPEAMVTRNIPAVSEALKAQVEQYSHVRSAAFVDWYPAATGTNPSGLLMTTRFGNTYQLHKLLQPAANSSLFLKSL